MELLYLLCSIISTTITSLLLSVFLPFRRISTADALLNRRNSVSLYQGIVFHERRRPVHHSFRYSVRYALIDLDNAPHPPPNHLSAEEARSASHTNGPVFLLTIPPSVGYEQNPLSVYYCYDIEGETKTLTKCIAEVTNTPWGERVTFLFNPNSDLVAKPLHVSPFMDMMGKWSLRTNDPADNLHIVISVQHPELGNYFTASLTAKRVASSASDNRSWFFWLMPHKVALWIYWHALKLWWKNVAFVQHPRYQNSTYREDAIKRDEGIHLCPSFGNKEALNHQREGTKMSNNHCFTWTDAKWPWC
ncbi:hypothetical protein SASPL_121561 [Salvia splendens]|uniref:DUF1365 domain-containing protein n=1 Tax=Salvia splendens TaxID=180675 RepID=A0A8X8XXI2_SALSN|nr:uncharacterized protein LOC121742155 [Salvia splendens]XP_041991142.1 uncharacterized protein LOC121742155 [Salvia splendens]XP_041991143.1 uncharacterized protein LOC121742155 [Salvia splendens]KAG6419341.1 hypothetical protein SASPL_121561 [Salvia splendens]